MGFNSTLMWPRYKIHVVNLAKGVLECSQSPRDLRTSPGSNSGAIARNWRGDVGTSTRGYRGRPVVQFLKPSQLGTRRVTTKDLDSLCQGGHRGLVPCAWTRESGALSLIAHGAWKVGPTISVGPGSRSGSKDHEVALGSARAPVPQHESPKRVVVRSSPEGSQERKVLNPCSTQGDNQLQDAGYY